MSLPPTRYSYRRNVATLHIPIPTSALRNVIRRTHFGKRPKRELAIPTCPEEPKRRYEFAIRFYFAKFGILTYTFAPRWVAFLRRFCVVLPPLVTERLAPAPEIFFLTSPRTFFFPNSLSFATALEHRSASNSGRFSVGFVNLVLPAVRDLHGKINVSKRPIYSFYGFGSA